MALNIVKILSVVVVVMCNMEPIFAAKRLSQLPEKPEGLKDKEGCYIKEINDVVPFGETVKPIGYCYKITCSNDLLSYASCGTVMVSGPGCYLTEVDLKLPYPQCCPKVKCDKKVAA